LGSRLWAGRKGTPPAKILRCVAARTNSAGKLEKFYATEATDASIRIEIPRGSYIPRFVLASVSKPQAPAVQPVAVLPLAVAAIQEAAYGVYARLAIAFVAGVVLTMVGMTAWNGSRGQSPRNAAWTPDLEAIWKPLIDSKVPILVSFQTRLFFNIGSLNVRDWNVDTIGALEKSAGLMRIKEFFKAPQLYENRNYVDFGSANAVFQLSKLLATRKQNIFAKRSTDVTWDDLKANNVISMGKPEADPTVSRWLAKGKFIETGGQIRNLHPLPGEQSEWVDHLDPEDSSRSWAEKYALITMLAGPGQGNWVMSIAGSGSEHAWAMADYLTIPEHATELVRHLRLPSGKLPASYQVVIRVDFKSQIPVKVSYVAHRSLDTP